MRQAQKERQTVLQKEEHARIGKKHTGLPTLQEPFDLETDRRRKVKTVKIEDIEETQEDDLLVEIDVTTPPNQLTVLRIYKNESITQVVKAFSLKFDLRAQTSARLES